MQRYAENISAHFVTFPEANYSTPHDKIALCWAHCRCADNLAAAADAAECWWCRKIRRRYARRRVSVNGRLGTSLACVVYLLGSMESRLRQSPACLSILGLACTYSLRCSTFLGATTGGRGVRTSPKFGRTPNFLHNFSMNRVWLCNRLHQTG